VKSQASSRFWQLFQRLPSEVQRLAEKNYRLWQTNPHHPSLRYRRLQGHDDLVSVRIGDRYRAVGLLADGAVIWIWVGPHAEYDQLIRGRSVTAVFTSPLRSYPSARAADTGAIPKCGQIAELG
jgi:mRNA-degrading endonuclease RelE of RelBE toxin-antitoxin system